MVQVGPLYRTGWTRWLLISLSSSFLTQRIPSFDCLLFTAMCIDWTVSRSVLPISWWIYCFDWKRVAQLRASISDVCWFIFNSVSLLSLFECEESENLKKLGRAKNEGFSNNHSDSILFAAQWNFLDRRVTSHRLQVCFCQTSNLSVSIWISKLTRRLLEIWNDQSGVLMEK